MIKLFLKTCFEKSKTFEQKSTCCEKSTDSWLEIFISAAKAAFVLEGKLVSEAKLLGLLAKTFSRLPKLLSACPQELFQYN